MSRDVIVVPPEIDLAAAWRIMHREQIRHLPVAKAGALIGILSDRDLLLRGTLLHGQLTFDSHDLAVHAMTPVPWVCKSGASVSSVAKAMLEKRIDAVPVLDEDGRIAGLVTSSDLVALLIDGGPEVTVPFRYRVHFVDGGA